GAPLLRPRQGGAARSPDGRGRSGGYRRALPRAGRAAAGDRAGRGPGPPPLPGAALLPAAGPLYDPGPRTCGRAGLAPRRHRLLLGAALRLGAGGAGAVLALPGRDLAGGRRAGFGSVRL